MHKGNEQKASYGDYPDWSTSFASQARTDDRGPGAQEDVCLAPGTLLQDGRYAILAVIPESRESELSIVYLAEHTALRRKLAIKEYFPRRVAHRSRSGAIAPSQQSTIGKRTFDDGIVAFEREAQQLAAIKHPNIVGVADVFRERGTVYLVMEYIDGINLSARLDEGCRADTRTLLAWLVPLLDAVSALHQARPPIYHRDIKPQNIRLRSSDRQPVLLDFGAARGLAGNTTLTMVHTPSYAPPEQTSNLQDSSAVLRPTLDIYAIGATTYHWLTGAPPPDAMQRSQFMMNKMADPLVPLTAQIADGRVDVRLLMVLDRSLGMRANDRPQSVTDIQVVIDTIRASMNGDTGETRRRWPVVAAGLSVGIALGVGVLFWTLGHSRPVEPPAEPTAGDHAPPPFAPTPGPSAADAASAAAQAASAAEAAARAAAEADVEVQTPPPPPETAPDSTAASDDARLASMQAFLNGQPLSFTANPGIFRNIEATLTIGDGILRIENLRFAFESEWAHDGGVREEIILAGQFKIYFQQASFFKMDAPHAESGNWAVDSAEKLDSSTFKRDAALEIPYQCASPEDLKAGKCSLRVVVGIGDSHTLLAAETLDPAESIK